MKRTTFFILLQILSVGLLSAPLVFSQAELETKMVLLRAVVTDKKLNAVEGLKQEQFTIEDDGLEQKISYFSNREEPVSVLILFDISASVEKATREVNAKAMLDFISKSNSENEYSIIAFNKEVVELTDWGKDERKITDSLNKVVEPKEIDGYTAFYDALIHAEKKLNNSKYPSKVILIFSDGQDSASRHKYREILRGVEESDAVIYSIWVMYNKDVNSLEGIQGHAFLNEMTEISGGSASYPRKASEMEEIIRQITTELKSRYAIGYIPTELVKNKDRRKVKVKVAANDAKGKKLKFTIRTRTSYFAKKN